VDIHLALSPAFDKKQRKTGFRCFYNIFHLDGQSKCWGSMVGQRLVNVQHHFAIVIPCG
jgi:hypothetical protein